MAALPSEVVIVGAGVFGASAALELGSRGHTVTLVDPGPLPQEGASSTDISKMVRMDYGSDVFYHELAEAALEGWDRWNAQWPRALYHETGFLVLARDAMRPGGFEHESLRVLRERGYDPPRMSSEELARRFPAWRSEAWPDGYFNPRGGWAESGTVVDRLLDLGRRAGVRLQLEAAASLVERRGRVVGVRLAGDGVVEAEHVLVCAGAWTPTLLPWMGDVLQSVAQPVLHLGVEDPMAFQGPGFPPFAADIAGSGWYGFPALPDGRLKIAHHGRGRAVDPDRRGTVDPDHVVRMRSFLAEAVPALAGAPLVGERVCMYCDSFDGDLWIDHDPERPGLIVAAGGSGHAFKFAPLLGPLIADVVEGRPNRWAHRFAWRAPTRRRTEEARHTGG